MRVFIAGAGAGKTTKMADLITDYKIPNGKIVFCIAFTNAAADNIRKKVGKKFGEIPNSIKISTIHSFLYQELIEPYYFLLYGKHFGQLSDISLPSNPAFVQHTLKELETANALHVTSIPEKAKWVAYKKSSDSKTINTTREKMLSFFTTYCAAIFVDEAQDISNDVKAVLEALDKAGIQIILYGDPKQDIKGYGCFQTIIDSSKDKTYISACYRCPQMHLDISNTLAHEAERQEADSSNAEGSVSFFFESEIANLEEFIENGNYGLQYICKKNSRFSTHKKTDSAKQFSSLRHEVYRAISEKWEYKKTDLEIKRAAYYVAERMLEKLDSKGNQDNVIKHWIKHGAFNNLSSRDYAKMCCALETKETISAEAVVVNSIESIKGLEASKCLFILTPDLAPYLFQEKTEDNKMRHLLYVALTRSLDHLTILVTREVEEKYSKAFILSYFQQLGTVLS